MKREEILIKLQEIFRQALKNDSIILSDDLNVEAIDEWDSFMHALIISEIENNFSIEFDFDDIDKTRNVGNLINIVFNKLNK
ncbi:MAG: acyl carrier protein [Endomicrobium sp.]|jgi:acyl carrier protein|nr:acyl carrier protein [Endomicrobium sp.]